MERREYRSELFRGIYRQGDAWIRRAAVAATASAVVRAKTPPRRRATRAARRA